MNPLILELFHWQIGLAIACLGILLAWIIKRTGQKASALSPTQIPDPATPDEQRHALIYLATLPHLRRLSDGTVFDYLHGSRIRFCECGQHSSIHLEVHYPSDRLQGIALVSRSELAQYIAVQNAVAQHLFGTEALK